MDGISSPFSQAFEPMNVDTQLELVTELTNIPSAFEPMDIDHVTDSSANFEHGVKHLNGYIFHGTKASDLMRQHLTKKKSVHKIKLTYVARLSNRLIGTDPIGTFVKNCERTLPDWITLIRKTMLPSFITSTDPRIISAFQAIDNVICGEGTRLLQRLAHVQLIHLFKSLGNIIKSDRDSGRIHRKPYYRDAKVAMDIYLSAQGTQPNTKQLRLQLKQGRKRLSKRWYDLSRISPLFVLVYSDAAEIIVYVAVTPKSTC